MCHKCTVVEQSAVNYDISLFLWPQLINESQSDYEETSNVWTHSWIKRGQKCGQRGEQDMCSQETAVARML